MKNTVREFARTLASVLAGGFFFLAAMSAALGVDWPYTLLYASLSGLMFMTLQLMNKKEDEE